MEIKSKEAWERVIMNSSKMGNKYTKVKINTRKKCIAEPCEARAGEDRGA